MNIEQTNPCLRILLVEDSEHDVLAFRRAFKKSKIDTEITRFEKAEEALDRLISDHSSYDLVVSDHKLPGMTGLALRQEMFANNVPLPMVLMTGNGSEHLAVDSMKAGVDDYMIKDFNHAHLGVMPTMLLNVWQKNHDRQARIRAEKALRKSEEYFKALFEQTGDSVLVLEIHDKGLPMIVDVNRSACEKHGYRREEMIGQPVSFLDPEEAEKNVERMELVMSGEQVTFEAVRTRKDGSTFQVEASVKLVRVENNKPFIYSIERDISEQKKTNNLLRDSVREWQDTFNSISDAITIHDMNFNVINSNEAANKLLGSMDAKNQVSAKKCFQLYHGTTAPPSGCASCQALKTGEACVTEVFEPYLNKYLEIKAFPRIIDKGEIKGLVHVVKDITERKQREEEVRQAKNMADHANQAKSSFLANMSHEIRTPMNAICGFVDLSLHEEISAKVRKNLNIVKTSSHSLLRLINDILDFSKIELGKLQVENIDFNLQEILFNLESMLCEKISEKGNQLVINRDDVPDALIGDPLRLGQILVNLVGNAIKFTSDGAISVTVSCRNSLQGAPLLHFSVQDTGVGIAKENLDVIFDAFTQADGSTTRNFGGTGLGLAISRQLVKLMGGELIVTSVLDEGSTFSFSIPLVAQTVDKQLPKAVVYQGIKILIADDVDIVVEVLRNMLQDSGFEVETASLPSTAMKMLRQAAKQNSPFDLVLMDIMMPEQDGITTAKEIRNDPLLADTPIIVLTGSGADLERQRASRVSINGFLLKPINRVVLNENIQMVLAGKVSRHNIIATQLEKSSPEPIGNLKILLVEDNKFNQLLAQEILQKAGIIVKVANNGREALEILDKTFDAIFMDVQMPEIDGLTATVLIRRCEISTQPKAREHQELLKKLSARIYGGRIPIIAMTANAMAGDREKCLEAGMDDYITKPFKEEDIFNALAGVTNVKANKISILKTA